MENFVYDNSGIRKRGRPVGKRRQPLSIEERKARNAQYERERRNEIADATSQLALAAGYDENITNADLFLNVIEFLKNNEYRLPFDDIDFIRTRNEEMNQEINELEEFLSERGIIYTDDELNVDPTPYVVQRRATKRKSNKSHLNGSTVKKRRQKKIKSEPDSEIEI